MRGYVHIDIYIDTNRYLYIQTNLQGAAHPQVSFFDVPRSGQTAVVCHLVTSPPEWTPSTRISIRGQVLHKRAQQHSFFISNCIWASVAWYVLTCTS